METSPESPDLHGIIIHVVNIGKGKHRRSYGPLPNIGCRAVCSTTSFRESRLAVRTKPQAAVAAAVAIESFCWPGDSRGRACSHVSTDCEAGGINWL